MDKYFGLGYALYMPTKKPRLQVVVTDDTRRRIENATKADGRTVSNWLARAAERALATQYFADQVAPLRIAESRGTYTVDTPEGKAKASGVRGVKPAAGHVAK